MKTQEEGAPRPEGGHPLVSVVIPTHGRPELLRQTLATIVEQDYPGPMEILVVHDGEDADPLKYLGPVAGFVNEAALNVCQNYSLRIPMQDELTVAMALGVAAYGFVGKPLATEQAQAKATEAEEPR